MKVWVTQRYAKDAPVPAELKMHGKQAWIHSPSGLQIFGYQEGVDYHRRYADAAATARANRDAWLRELTSQAAEIASLPPIQESA